MGLPLHRMRRVTAGYADCPPPVDPVQVEALGVACRLQIMLAGMPPTADRNSMTGRARVSFTDNDELHSVGRLKQLHVVLAAALSIPTRARSNPPSVIVH